VSGSEREFDDGGTLMTVDYLLGGLVALGLLVYALLRPERF
jgi:hypothetical protein